MSRADDRLELLTLELRYEHDVVLARQRTRQISEQLGFDGQDQIRLATAVSELTRNAFRYAGGGRVRFAVDRSESDAPLLTVRISDDGPGITDLQGVLDGRYHSTTGMGLGLLGARRLTEHFEITTVPGVGTTVEVGRTLPVGRRQFTQLDAARIADALARTAAAGPFEELQQQNQELLRALDEVRTRKAEIERLHAELQETNRGVLALYAELDDRAHDLKRASEAKSRFLSEMSHELRTPLTSVLNLSRILLDRTDGELTSEQEYQINLIRRSVLTLTEMVNDLLDLAKIEAGKIEARPAFFSVSDLFAALRGMCRPLISADVVALVFDDASALPLIHTDEGRLSQILRNFISNAIKFTERGEVRVSARIADGELIRFDVADTGIGIALADQERIFHEYAQIDGPMQRRAAGTGLGLPLTRRLAALLAGRVELSSTPGRGSTFSVVIPLCWPSEPERGAGRDESTGARAAYRV
jgi:signal transduction histidine kinase